MKAQANTLRTVFMITMVLLTVFYALPMYVVLLTSLKTPADIIQRQYLLPSLDLHFENFAQAFQLTYKPLLNSTIISVTVTLLTLLFGGLGGFYLSRARTRFSKVLFILVGIGLYLPYQVILIPLTVIMAQTGLALTHFGLILSYLVLNMPLASVLLGTFFTGLPRELEEAAEVDGASKIQTFFNVVTPVALPAYASTAIIIFTQVWNEFFLALVLSTPSTTTIQVQLSVVKGSFMALYNLQMAAALIALAVPLLFFLLLGNYFIKGILAGALKG